MSKQNKRNSIIYLLGSMGWPLILGLAVCAGFYALVHQGIINDPLINRYFAGHLIEYIETAMFCVGIAALFLKLLDIFGQQLTMSQVSLGPRPDHALHPNQSADLLDKLDQLSERARNSYFGRRIIDALELIHRKGSADSLEDELKYMADIDAGRQHDSYSLVRIVIWATPMLGFLGTVVGITLALGNLSPTSLAESPQEAMKGLLSGLSIAFDTTALALSLSILLMFILFFINSIEVQLLATVDNQVNEELVGRFQQFGGGGDPHVASIQRMNESVVQATHQLVQQQAELWKSTIDASHQRWNSLIGTSSDQIQTALAGALDQSLQKHAMHIEKTELAAAEQVRQRCEQWQVTLSDNARIMHAQQKELHRQGEIMSQVLAATGNIANLESHLNENLKTLAGSKNFEDTVMSLSAAIHLLNTQLGKPAAERRKIELKHSPSQDRAA